MDMDTPLVLAALDDLTRRCHRASRSAGWYTDLTHGGPTSRNIPEMLCLIHSEISEALEGYRKSKMDDHLPNRQMIEVELADAMIRIFDLAGYLDLELGDALFEKLAYNRDRAAHVLEARRHGGKRF